MPVRIQLRRDTAANWTATNPTLTQGEPGYETDTGKIKYGDGTTAWNSLAYAPAAAIVDGTIVNGDINASAAIADTKLATISTAGKVSNSATTATNANTASAIVARDASGNFTAGTITASLSGNASTATTFETARTINGVSFNGSSNITVTANTPNTLTRGTYLTGTDFNGGAATTWAVDATSANTASKVVARDASGNFSAGTITAALNGNASTATILQTARTINGVSFNGSSNITVTANSPNTLTRGTYLTGSNFNGSAATTWAVDATSANTASKVVARDASGNFSAGTITAALSGNATTATTLQTARTINGTSFNGSANITTANWGTSRTLTVGNTGKAVNGSAAVSWSLAEIGAFPSAGGTVTGNITIQGTATFTDSQRFPTVVANSVANTSYTLTASDAGAAVIATTTVVAPASVMSAGHAVTVFNNSSADISITAGAGLTLYQAGTTNQGSRTLAQRGLALIYYINSQTAVISGAGIS
jgi:hypothetical protein